jgi:hypothetical protein
MTEAHMDRTAISTKSETEKDLVQSASRGITAQELLGVLQSYAEAEVVEFGSLEGLDLPAKDMTMADLEHIQSGVLLVYEGVQQVAVVEFQYAGLSKLWRLGHGDHASNSGDFASNIKAPPVPRAHEKGKARQSRTTRKHDRAENIVEPSPIVEANSEQLMLKASNDAVAHQKRNIEISALEDDESLLPECRPSLSPPEENGTEPHPPFRDEKVSLLVAAKQGVDAYRAAIDLAVGKAEPELFKALTAIFAWTLTMSQADRKQFLAEEDIKENGNQKNPLTPVVKGFFQRVRAVDPSNYTKYAGVLALAKLRGIKAGDFATWVRDQRIEKAYNTYRERSSEKEINPEASQSAHTRRAEQTASKIDAFLGKPRSPPIEAPVLSADLQEGVNYIAVIRKVNDQLVILRTLDYDRPAITRMLHRCASKVQP